MAHKTIHRRKLRGNFVALPNEMLRAASLSFRARGILAMMLSHSEEWRSSMKALEQHGTEGREAIRSAIQELEMAGYAVRKTMLKPNGTFDGVLWTWHDTPIPLSQRSKPNDGKPSDGKPTDGKPSDGKPSQLRNTIVENNNGKESRFRREKDTKGGRGYSESELSNMPDIAF